MTDATSVRRAYFSLIRLWGLYFVKRIIKCSIIAICVLFIVFVYVKFFSPDRYYEKDYFAVLGVADSGATSDDLTKLYGKPKHITVTDGFGDNPKTVRCYEYVFDDFSAVLASYPNRDGTYREPPICTSLFRIYTDRFKFGGEKLSVGSSKEEVRAAYKKCKKTKKADENDLNADNYSDNHVYISYYYDENDIVELIVFFRY